MNKSETEYNAFMLNDLDKKILQVVLSSDTPVAGKQLASFCNVSVNTIRSEIDTINAYIIPHGCRIDSKVSIGYSLDILDNVLADQFLSQLIIEASRYTYMNLTIFARAYYIVRTLLVSTVPVNIDNLADQMFCSRSTVLRNLPAAKKYVEAYDLSLKERRNSGLYIDGTEWNKRICLLAQHKIYSNTPADLKGDEPEFCGQLLMHSNFRKPIEKAVLSTLKQVHFPLPKIYVTRFVNSIILNKTRIGANDSISFTDEQLSVLEQLDTISTAHHLYESMPDYFRTDHTEQDERVLAVLLACYGTRYTLEDIPAEWQSKCNEEFVNSIRYITKTYNIGFLYDRQFRNALSCYIFAIHLRRLFHVKVDHETVSQAATTGLSSADICAQFGLYYQNELHMTLSDSDIIGAYYIFNRSVYEHQQYLRRKNVFVISMYGVNYAENYSVRFHKMYPDYIKYLQCLEITEIPESYATDDDIIITDIARERIPPNLPCVIQMKNYRSMSELKRLGSYFERNTFESAVALFPKENYHKTNLSSKSEVLQRIAETLFSSSDEQKALLKDIEMREHVVTFEREKGITLITTANTHFQIPVFHVFINRHDIQWENQDSHIFIFYSHGDGSNMNMQLISYLIRLFSEKPISYLNTIYPWDYDSFIKSLNIPASPAFSTAVPVK